MRSEEDQISRAQTHGPDSPDIVRIRKRLVKSQRILLCSSIIFVIFTTGSLLNAIVKKSAYESNPREFDERDNFQRDSVSRAVKDEWNVQEWRYEKAAEGQYFNDKWHSATGEEEFAFTCEVEVEEHTKKCKNKTWFGPFGNSCYMTYHDRATYEEAKELCPKKCQSCRKKPYLVRITSEDENLRVHRSCGARQSCWIGVKYNVVSKDWLLEGEPVSVASFTAWAENEPRRTADGQTFHHAYMSKGPNFHEVLMEDWESWDDEHDNEEEQKDDKDDEEDDEHDEEDDEHDERRRDPHDDKKKPEERTIDEHEDPEKAKYNNRWHDAPSDTIFPFVCELSKQTKCPDESWLWFDNSCYRKSENKASYSSAQTECMGDHHGNLASIASDRENNVVWEVCGSGTSPCWIGLHELPSTEEWRWETGEPVDYSHWEAGEPNNYDGKDEDAAFMGFNWAYFNEEYWNEKWYDAPRYVRMPFVCEVAASSCPESWKGPYSFSDGKETPSCYKFVGYKKTMREAKIYCAKGGTGGYLVSINSAGENTKVHQICGGSDRDHPCWIGFYEPKDSETYVWDSGEETTYTNWQSGEPNNYNGVDEDAVFMGFNWSYFEGPYYGPEWFDAPNDLFLPFVCEVESSSCPDESWNGPHTFPSSGTSCYKLFKERKEYQSGAMNVCAQQHDGSHLVTIESEDENMIVHEVGSSRFPIWIGLVERHDTEDWYWLNKDGRSPSYTNWAEGEPNNWDGVDETATFMGFNWDYFTNGCHERRDSRLLQSSDNSSPQRLLDQSIDRHGAPERNMFVNNQVTYNDGGKYDSLWYDGEPWMYFPFVCEQRIDGGRCEKRWRTWGSSCYKLFQQKAQVWDAEETCRDAVPGGHLTAIQSEAENDFVHRTCGGHHPCWIGLEENSSAIDGWSWSSGESMRFTKWSPGKRGRGDMDPGEKNRVFMGFNYRYWKNGEAGQAWWDDESLRDGPSRREKVAFALEYGVVFMILALVLVVFSAFNFCLWMNMAVEKRTWGLICSMFIQLVHCIFSAMILFACLVWAAGYCGGSFGCTDAELSLGIAGPPLLLLIVFMGAYTFYAALKVRSSIKYVSRRSREPASVQVYGSHREEQEMTANRGSRSGNQGGAVMGLPVYQPPSSKGDDITAGLAYDPATVVVPGNMNNSPYQQPYQHPYHYQAPQQQHPQQQDPYRLHNEYVPPLARVPTGELPSGELLIDMPEYDPDSSRQTSNYYPASNAPPAGQGVYPSLS